MALSPILTAGLATVLLGGSSLTLRSFPVTFSDQPQATPAPSHMRQFLDNTAEHYQLSYPLAWKADISQPDRAVFFDTGSDSYKAGYRKPALVATYYSAYSQLPEAGRRVHTLSAYVGSLKDQGLIQDFQDSTFGSYLGYESTSLDPSDHSALCTDYLDDGSGHVLTLAFSNCPSPTLDEQNLARSLSFTGR